MVPLVPCDGPRELRETPRRQEADQREFFVPVKVDRDERPDVDSRYQAAAAAISGQGGWPLTAFLTPDGKPYFAGTYFPPVDAHGRPSFRRVLFTMAEAFQKQRGDVIDSAESVMEAIEQNETFDGSAKEPGEALVGKIVDAVLKQFDPRYGGFGVAARDFRIRGRWTCCSMKPGGTMRTRLLRYGRRW